jgi:hypothetical protein
MIQSDFCNSTFSQNFPFLFSRTSSVFQIFIISKIWVITKERHKSKKKGVTYAPTLMVRPL